MGEFEPFRLLYEVQSHDWIDISVEKQIINYESVSIKTKNI